LKIVAIIPARAGSKGLPGKNMRIFAGKPLVQHAIEAARSCDRIAAVYVTSDDASVLDLARSSGAVAIERPGSLAGDDTSMTDVVRHLDHAIDAVGGAHGDAFALMQPTSPLKTPEDIAACLEHFASGAWASAVTVCALEHPPQKALVVEDGLLEPLFGWEALQSNRQQLVRAYRQNGAIWVVRWDAFRACGRFVVSPAMPFVMDAARSVDIDSGLDFEAAEELFMATRDRSLQ
jgi:CMP-N-acetylneuraminic acid synthetase